MEELVGRTIKSIDGCTVGSDNILITFEDDSTIEFYHSQDCCECVDVEDVVGNPEKHIGATLYGIDVKSNSDSLKPDLEYDSYTWTFYTIKTSAGYLDIRWFGSSNGYYSESVEFSTRVKQ